MDPSLEDAMDRFTLDKLEFDSLREILARMCRCSLGAALARKVRPARQMHMVQRWLEQTNQMVQAVRDVGLAPLGGIIDVRDSIRRAQPGGQGGGQDFADIASAMETAALVRRYLLNLPEDLDLLSELAGGIGRFEDHVEAIRSVVASDGAILDRASDKLRRIRRDIDATATEAHEVAYRFLRQADVRKLLQDPTVTLHEDRFVLPVRAENRGRLPGVVHRTSGSGATVFVEPTACVELNNHLADLRDDERTEINRLLNDLSLKLAKVLPEVAKALTSIAHVDLLTAKAQYAYQFDMTCPEISDDGVLELPQARHPLLIDQVHRRRTGESDTGPTSVVPTDIRLGSDFDILIITGSNTGGKTVCLKTVAMLIVMAHCGMHLPTRRGAKVPMVEDILLDIGDEQSLEQSLSTFGGHIARLKAMLERAGENTLVLLDELGSGTDPDEGGAIGQAVLDELRRVKCKAMVTTHLSVLKAYAFNHDRVDNASVEFDTETLKPTYHLRIGTPGESHAITVAQHLGLPGRVIDGARKHLPSQGKQFSKAIRATGQARQDAEAARSDAQEAQLAAENQAQVYEDKLLQVKHLREEFEAWLAMLVQMAPGEELHIPSLNRTGKLVRLQLHNQLAVVDIGNIQAEIPLMELMPQLGQEKLRRQFNDLRRDLQDRQKSADDALAKATRLEAEARAHAADLRQRQEAFDTWAQAVATAQAGDMVTINRKPGMGTLIAIDHGKRQATVRTNDGKELKLPVKDLFPQTGRYAKVTKDTPVGRKLTDKPLRHGKATGKKAASARKSLAKLAPGDKVFVISFDQSYTLVRIDEAKDIAIVQAGAFELSVALSDCRVAKS
jgi:DNA mismatch repair protein MutS2